MIKSMYFSIIRKKSAHPFKIKNGQALYFYKFNVFVFHRDFPDLPTVIRQFLFECQEGMIYRKSENFFNLLIVQYKIILLLFNIIPKRLVFAHLALPEKALFSKTYKIISATVEPERIRYIAGIPTSCSKKNSLQSTAPVIASIASFGNPISLIF